MRRVDAERVAPPPPRHPLTRVARKGDARVFFSLRDTSTLRRDRNVRKEQPVPSAQFALPVLFPCDTQLPQKGDAPATRAPREWRKRSARCKRGKHTAREFFAAERLRRQDGRSIPSLRLAAQGMVTAYYNNKQRDNGNSDFFTAERRHGRGIKKRKIK